MDYLVSIVSNSGRETTQVPFKSLEDARNFAKAATKGYKVDKALIYDLLNDARRIEGYQLDLDGDPEWMVF